MAAFTTGDRVLLRNGVLIGNGPPLIVHRGVVHAVRVELDIIRHYCLKVFTDDGKPVDGIFVWTTAENLRKA